MSRRRFSIAKAMTLIAVVGLGMGAFVQYRRTDRYYAAGWWDAERELWQGTASIYGGSDFEFCDVDRDTGLLITHRDTCFTNEYDRERNQGHNDHIAQYIRWHGLPRNTLKPWEKELFHLKQWFDETSQTVAPTRLVAGGQAVVSPDGRNSVRPVLAVNDDGSPDNDSLKVVIAAGNVVLDDWYARAHEGESDLLWGPDGSRFVVIRSITTRGEEFQAFDLRTGRQLRQENGNEGWRPDDL